MTFVELIDKLKENIKLLNFLHCLTEYYEWLK